MATRQSDLEFLIPQTSGIGDIVSAITEKVKENELNILKLLYQKGVEEQQKIKERLANLSYVDALSNITIKEETVDEKGNIIFKERPLLNVETLKNLADVSLYTPQKDFLTMIDNLIERLIRQGIATGEQITQLKRIQEDARLRQQQQQITETYWKSLAEIAKERVDVTETGNILDFISRLKTGLNLRDLIFLTLAQKAGIDFPQSLGSNQKSQQPNVPNVLKGQFLLPNLFSQQQSLDISKEDLFEIVKLISFIKEALKEAENK
jgi:predicted nucleic acid-binding protein